LKAVAEGFLETNTFGANPFKLAQYGLAARTPSGITRGRAAAPRKEAAGTGR